MTHSDELHISPYWAGFKRIWAYIAIALLLLLLILWLIGYGPGGKACQPKAVKAVKITDTIAPILSLNGGNAATLRIPLGTPFSDTGATARDNNDGDVSVNVLGHVDTNTPGSYLLTYTATDSAGNTSKRTRTIIVETAAKTATDTTKPRIILNGDSVIRIPIGRGYKDAGAKAYDTVDGDLKVTKTGQANAFVLGQYEITYTATDAAGNTATDTRKVIVVPSIDTTAPRLKLVGTSIIRIPAGTLLTDPGATAIDDTDGKISVTVKGVLNSKVPGRYELTYTATDTAGNTSTTTRTVIVTDTAKDANTLPAAAKLYFGFDQSTRPNDRESSLPAVLRYLRNHPDSKAIVSGFHDPSGNIIYNKALAKQRATTVGKLLQREGISNDRIVLEKPVVTTGSGSSAEARRVEVNVK